MSGVSRLLIAVSRCESAIFDLITGIRNPENINIEAAFILEYDLSGSVADRDVLNGLFRSRGFTISKDHHLFFRQTDGF